MGSNVSFLKERMVGHWDTFYTFEDFEKLANGKHLKDNLYQ